MTDETPHRRNGDASYLDPTTNVLAAVEAAVERQDDLRAQEAKHLRGMMALLSSFDKVPAPPPLPAIPKNVLNQIEQEGHRQDGLRNMAHVALRREMALTAKYEDRLRKAETKRINAIRAVDVGNVREAALVQATNAKTLEVQVATSADTLRKQVESTAVAARLDQTTALAPIQKNIEDLRQTMWAQQGEKTQKTESGADDRWRVGTIVAGAGCLVSAVMVTVMILALIVTVVSGHLK